MVRAWRLGFLADHRVRERPPRGTSWMTRTGRARQRDRRITGSSRPIWPGTALAVHYTAADTWRNAVGLRIGSARAGQTAGLLPVFFLAGDLRRR